MHVTTAGRHDPGIAVVEISGPADDPATAPKLRAYLRALINAREGEVADLAAPEVFHLVLDVRQLTALDPTHLGALVHCALRIRDCKGGTLRTAGVTGVPRKLIHEVARLGQVLPDAPDIATALEQIRTAPAEHGGTSALTPEQERGRDRPPGR